MKQQKKGQDSDENDTEKDKTKSFDLFTPEHIRVHTSLRYPFLFLPYISFLFLLILINFSRQNQSQQKTAIGSPVLWRSNYL